MSLSVVSAREFQSLETLCDVFLALALVAVCARLLGTRYFQSLRDTRSGMHDRIPQHVCGVRLFIVPSDFSSLGFVAFRAHHVGFGVGGLFCHIVLPAEPEAPLSSSGVALAASSRSVSYSTGNTHGQQDASLAVRSRRQCDREGDELQSPLERAAVAAGTFFRPRRGRHAARRRLAPPRSGEDDNRCPVWLWGGERPDPQALPRHLREQRLRRRAWRHRQLAQLAHQSRVLSGRVAAPARVWEHCLGKENRGRWAPDSRRSRLLCSVCRYVSGIVRCVQRMHARHTHSYTL